MVSKTFKWILSFILRLFLYSRCFFKFTDSYETIYIFGVLGVGQVYHGLLITVVMV